MRYNKKKITHMIPLFEKKRNGNFYKNCKHARILN